MHPLHGIRLVVDKGFYGHHAEAMKIGPRKPSLKGRISARLSPARFVRHNLGLKAPRGYGWFTDPKKALYNRIYNRTTFDVVGLVLKSLFGKK